MARTKKHKITLVPVCGRPVAVDVEIVALVNAVNSIPGVTTKYSCQGGSGHGLGYISFCDKDKETRGSRVRFLQKLIPHMAVAERRCELAEAKYVAEHGPRHGTFALSLYFTLELGGTNSVIRWFPNTYPVLLKIVRRIGKEMRKNAA